MQDPNTHETGHDAIVGSDADASSNSSSASSTEAGEAPRSASAAKASFPGLKIPRRYTEPGEDVWSTVEWEKRSAVITDGKGEVVFEQHDIETPKSYTQLATNVIASKYFRGHVGTPEREHSVRQLIQRVSYTIADWGKAMGYFASDPDYLAFRDELTHLLLHQKAAFNSPVWFNVGLKDQPAPQCSACQPYHARVLTEHGPMPIGDIVAENRVGLRVFDGEGLTDVVAVKHNGRKQVFRIELEDGFTVEATGDHLVCAHAQRRSRQLEWRRVDALSAGLKMRVYPHAARTFVPAASSVEIAEAALAGWLQADGFVGQYASGTNRSLTIEFLVNGQEEFDWVTGHLEAVFPDIHRHVRDVETQAGTPLRRIRLYGEVLRPFVEKYDLLRRGATIRVPTRVFTASDDAVLAYLVSVFQSEGYITIQGGSARIGLAVISAEWTRDIQALLTRIGIYSRRVSKTDRREDRNNTTAVEISLLSERAKFARCVGFLSEAKNAKLVQSLAMKGKRCPDIRFTSIRSIEPVGETDVYDIQTTSGKYLSDGILVHNCFINSVDDTMESILGLAKTEGMLFKFGSGTGTNLSPLRSSREHLQGGGTASGPVSFMRGFDAFAGVIKSGGKTRRAAKMVILNVDHPDIMQFITCKADEEKKAWALIDAGYNGNFNVPGGAYDSVSYQNANHSVRVTDEFMEAYLGGKDWFTREVTTGEPDGTYKAAELMRAISDAAWVCGDPGMQYDTTINRWHTSKATDRIHASNPCVTGDTMVATADGWQRIDSLVGKSARVIGADGQPHYVSSIFPTGTKQVYRLRTRAGYEVRITGDHKVLTTDRGDVPVRALCVGDRLFLQGGGFGRRTLSDGLGFAIGAAVGDGCLSRSEATGRLQEIVTLVMARAEAPILQKVASEIGSLKQTLRPTGSLGRADAPRVSLEREEVSRFTFSSQPVVALFKEFAVLDEGSDRKRFTPAVFELDRPSVAAMLRGLFTTDGTVANYGAKSQYVALDSTSEELLQQVQLLLLGFGIKAKIYRERRAGSSESRLPDGRGGMKTYAVKEMHSLRISRSSRFVFAREIGFDAESPKSAALAELNASVGAYRDTLTDEVCEITELGEEAVFDLTEPVTSHFSANGLLVHNCSEYMFLNDSACNLASLNLMKFRREDGEFDVDGYKHACRILITAQEIIVDNASYPTERIGINSHDYRPLGLGYANLGALLMSRGVAYDSDAGRALAGALTAIMTGEAYHQSAIVARDHRLMDRSTGEYLTHGAFPGYPPNREAMLDVMRMHRAAVEHIDAQYVPDDVMHAARSCWDRAIELGERYGYRNAQATVLAPTGTIGFMMDCDTTGIEPDIAIVKYKNLVGGGLMKIVNNTVPEALRRLGYDDTQVGRIVQYIDEHDTIEGAPDLKPEHLPIFDCAFKPANGSRSIHYMGHVKMMAAAQPFISGAISKTVNMPTEATAQEITDVYVEGWRLGLKAIAIYRDGSKRTQPLSTSRGEGNKETGKPGNEETPAPAVSQSPSFPISQSPAPEARIVRRKLPDERRSITHKFSIAGHEGYITVGMYEDGTPGEIFLTMSKEGSTISGLMDTIATMTSLALQYGVPLETLVKKFAHMRFEPSGITPNPDIRFAKSIPDYIFRWLGTKFLPQEALPGEEQSLNGNGHDVAPATPPATPAAATAATQMAQTDASQATPRALFNPFTTREKEIFENMADAPACAECGALMVRNGACYKCLNCGSVFGCS